MGRFVLSAFSDEYSSALDGQIEALKKFNIGFIELRHADGLNVADFTDGYVDILADKLSAAGIKVSSIGSPIGKIPVDGDLEAHFDKAEKVFRTAKRLGSKYVRIFSFYPPSADSALNRREATLSALSRLLDLADVYDVTLCHENEANIYGESIDACFELLEHFGGRLKCVLDMGNFVLDGCDPMRAYDVLKNYIAYFHIKDALYKGAVVPAGKGEAKIKEVLERYASDFDSDVFITLEPHLQTFDGLNALVGKSFDNPYKYASAELAFSDAVDKLRKLLEGML